MIKIIQVLISNGKTILNISANFPDGSIKTMQVDYAEIENRLKQVEKLLGRKASEQDFKDVLNAIVNEAREGKRPLDVTLPFTQYINVDLEG